MTLAFSNCKSLSHKEIKSSNMNIELDEHSDTVFGKYNNFTLLVQYVHCIHVIKICISFFLSYLVGGGGGWVVGEGLLVILSSVQEHFIWMYIEYPAATDLVFQTV